MGLAKVNTLEKEILKGTFINGASVILLALLPFFLIPIQIHYLGIAGFGLVAATTLFSILGPIALLDLAIPSAASRYISDYANTKRNPSANSLILSLHLFMLVVGAFACILFMLLRDVIFAFLSQDEILPPHQILQIIDLFAISFIWQFVYIASRSALIAHKKFLVSQGIDLITELIRFFAVWWALKQDGGALEVITVNVILTAFKFIVCLIAVRYFGMLRVGRLVEFDSRGVYELAAKLYVGRASSLIYNNVDKLVITFVLGPASYGLYEVFSKIPLLLGRFLNISVSAVIPSVSGMSLTDERESIVQAYENGFRWFVMLSLPVFCMAIVFADNILTLWIGSVDPELATYMQIMLCAILITFLNFGGNFLVALNVGIGNLVKYRVGQMLLRATALVALISWLDLLAAPIAMAISSLLTIYLLMLFRKVFSISIMRQCRVFMSLFFVNIGICLLFSTFLPVSSSSLVVSLSCYLVLLGAMFGLTFLLFAAKQEKVWVSSLYSKIFTTQRGDGS